MVDFFPIGLLHLAFAYDADIPSARSNLPRCYCFSTCHPGEAHRFLARLPVVTSPSSPWYGYLQRLYQEDVVPLPVDLSDFGAFMLPSLTSARGMPFTQLCGPTGRSIIPECDASDSTCAGWLDFSEKRAAQLSIIVNETLLGPAQLEIAWRSPEIGGTQVVQYSIAYNKDRTAAAFADMRLPAAGGRSWIQFNFHLNKAGLYRHLNGDDMLLRRTVPVTNASMYPPHTWIEVQRREMYNPEGLIYGCCKSPKILTGASGWFALCYVVPSPSSLATMTTPSCAVSLPAHLAEHGCAAAAARLDAAPFHFLLDHKQVSLLLRPLPPRCRVLEDSTSIPAWHGHLYQHWPHPRGQKAQHLFRALRVNTGHTQVLELPDPSRR